LRYFSFSVIHKDVTYWRGIWSWRCGCEHNA